jgi:RND family efflux transporter MFP subunit
MKNSYKFLLTTVIMIASMAIIQACTDSKGQNNSIPKTAEPIPVKVISIEKTSGNAVIVTSGRISTDDETVLSFKTGGVVNSVFVKEGAHIKKGQLLATLDLTEINAITSQARHGFEKAERDLFRTQNLYRDSVATLEQLENAQTAFELAKEQLNAATFNRSFSEIHAPADGFVLRKFLNAGQVVGIGDPVLLTNGADHGKWILKAGVSDKQWAEIKISDPASVKIDAIPDLEFKGVVIRKSETSDPATGTFVVEIEIKSERSKLASGMFASAKINSGESISSWSLPYEAVLDANGNNGFVFITNDNKKAIRKSVTIESFNGKTIRVTSGLEDAAAVIIAGSAYLSDSSPITIVK